MGFKDHFSEQAPTYAAFRPGYPEALFEFLADAAPAHRHAWDCACGSGQAAVGLVRHFKRVTATDASPAQLAPATPHPRITYAQAPAEDSGLGDASVDLVVVAQALHWFRQPDFYREVQRVLAPGGVLAVWCYDLLTIEPEIDALLLQLYRDTLGPWWPEERAQVEAGYRNLEFPFDEISAPRFEIEQGLTLEGLSGYLHSWSATQRYKEANGGEDPVAPAIARIAPLWGGPEVVRPARWPLSCRIGHRRG